MQVPAPAAAFQRRESLGTMMMAGGRSVWPHYFSDYLHWGDFTIRPRRAPDNRLPTLTATVDKASVAIGETVTFRIGIQDADAATDDNPSIPWKYRAELWPTGYQPATPAGTREPALAQTWTGTTVSGGVLAWAYPAPHAYTARIEVSDEWQARRVKEFTIAVAPRPDQPLRVNCGAEDADWTDADGRIWLYDQEQVAGTWGFASAKTDIVQATVAGQPGIYSSCRLAKDAGKPVTWSFPVANGTWTVSLHFADLINTAAGKSLADLRIEGVAVLTGFDVFAAAGGARRPVVRTFTTTVADGMLTIVLARAASATNAAFLNAIEIVPVTGDHRQRSIILEPVAPAIWTVRQPLDAVISPGPGAGQTVHLLPTQTAVLAPQAVPGTIN